MPRNPDVNYGIGPSTFPGKQPDPCPGQIGLEGAILSSGDVPGGWNVRWEVHIDRERIADGDCITVTRLGDDTVVARGKTIRLLGAWDVVQWNETRPCGASVTLVTKNGEWRIIA